VLPAAKEAGRSGMLYLQSRLSQGALGWVVLELKGLGWIVYRRGLKRNFS
jgi:hypothetical protein